MLSLAARAALLLAAVSALTACVRDAHIATASSLSQSAERLALRGMGGGTRGSFKLGTLSGRFSRGAERADFGRGDLIERRGGGTFTLAGAELGGNLSGRCRFDQSDANFGSVTVEAEAFLYTCTFARDGRPVPGELVLEAAPHLYKEKRTGVLRFAGEEIALRSIHQDQGGGVATHAPLGYAFELNGEQIGAVDLNGTDKTIYAPRDLGRREAVLVAALALSILWDPAGDD